MNQPCGCGEALQPLTPSPISNRPGLDALAYRVGTHAAFLATMQTRLSGVPVLRSLATRDPSDYSIALLDAWAIVADVLTFYQERIANEGFLRTATERRSILELARLIGYELRPGVSASVFLAYTLEKNITSTLSPGQRAQSVPGPGELPQSFETSDPLEARTEWNNLGLRMTRPQVIPRAMTTGHRVFFDGIATKLRPNDPLLFGGKPDDLYRVKSVTPAAAAGRTTVVLQKWREDPAPSVPTVAEVDNILTLALKSPPVDEGQFSTDIRLAITTLQESLKESTTRDRLDDNVERAIEQLDFIKSQAPTPASNWFTLLLSLQGSLSAFIIKPRVDAIAALDLPTTSSQDPTILTITALMKPWKDRTLTFADPRDFARQLQFTIEAIKDAKNQAVVSEKTQDLATQIDTLFQGLTNILSSLPPGADVGALQALAERANTNLPVSTGKPDDDFINNVQGAMARIASQGRNQIGKQIADKIDAALAEFELTPFPDPSTSSINPLVLAWAKPLIDSLDPIKAGLTVGEILPAAQAIVSRALDPVGAGIDVTDTEIAKRVIDSLNTWIQALPQSGERNAALALLRMTITRISLELDIVEKGGYPRLEPWLSALVADLEDAAQEFSATIESSAHSVNGTGAALGTAPVEGPSIDLSKLLSQLQEPSSQPPASPFQLTRNITDVFSPSSQAHGQPLAFADITTQLLVTFDPRLKSSLTPALSNVEVSPSDQVAAAYAFRTSAAPFGANAPLRPIIQGGLNVGSEEWRLASLTFEAYFPQFPAKLSSPDNTNVELSINGVKNASPVSLAQNTVTIGDVDVRITTDAGATPQTIKFELFRKGETTNPIETLVISLTAGQTQVQVTFDNESVQVSSDQPTFQSAAAGFASVVKLIQPKGGHVSLVVNHEIPWPLPADQRKVLSLDGVHDQITPGGWVVIERLDATTEKLKLQVRRVISVATLALANYGISAKVTQLTLDTPWLDENDTTLAAIRNTAVYAQSESLKLSEAPYDADILKGTDVIDLDGVYDGLKSGRWVIISGERTDIPATSGVFASELAMVQSVKQDIARIPQPDHNLIDLPGDKLHSYLVLSQKLNYSYKRASVILYGNVAKATHGETRQEVLGSGDSSQTLQHFTLKQTPLTYLSSPTPRGAETTLQVRVNEVLWHEVDSLVSLGPKDRKYVTQTDDNDHVSVIFGNGEQGARLPTGQENVKSTYRFGTGSPGNVRAQQISLLSTRPLGVKAVINPLAASGGADREDRDQARRNAPRSVTSLDRLVSVRDYEDFARTFAGIAKASAVRYFDDQQREAVYVTVAGTDDIPIDEASDLLNNLRLALRQSGDLFLPVEVHRRELITVVLSAEVRRDPDYLWDDVAARIRTSLLTAFGFNNRDLATDLWLSAVIAVIQNVPGVEYVNIQAFVGVPEFGQDGKSIITPDEIKTKIIQSLPASQPSSTGNATLPRPSIIAKPARFECQVLRPAQLAMMLANVPDTLILKEVAQ